MAKRITINLTDTSQRRLEEISNLTNLTNNDVFKSALTLLYIHIEAALKGQRVRVGGNVITLPFKVRK